MRSLDNTVLAEELGLDGFGVGERHEAERGVFQAAPEDHVDLAARYGDPLCSASVGTIAKEGDAA
ncbi:hypothetical protein [Streptomyces sp. CBMA29]|uniref:hypothetical protein n=1 Tax=Streptomyces sp. CBMA29 TaxID=1896314 RepID=UPI00166196F6|nr:hypothetical protein [Streptomyces sp. CBMA29]MBD0737764.1 hypothetical protein [Streptomyces sp. CBMA29]